MFNGVVLGKLRSLDDTLEELYSLGPVTFDLLKDDWRTSRAAERDLHIFIEIVVDVCQRLISLAGETPAETGAEALKRCAKLGGCRRSVAILPADYFSLAIWFSAGWRALDGC